MKISLTRDQDVMFNCLILSNKAVQTLQMFNLLKTISNFCDKKQQKLIDCQTCRSFILCELNSQLIHKLISALKTKKNQTEDSQVGKANRYPSTQSTTTMTPVTHQFGFSWPRSTTSAANQHIPSQISKSTNYSTSNTAPGNQVNYYQW